MALSKKFITAFACVLSACSFFACSESKLDGSPTGTVDVNASSSSTSDVGTCNALNINDIKFVAAENAYYRCDGLNWVPQSSSSTISSSSNTSGVNVFATLEDLPNCTISRENQLAVVSTTNTPYMCTEGRWVVYGISSSSSLISSSSATIEDPSSSSIVSSSSVASSSSLVSSSSSLSSSSTLSSSSIPTLSSSSTPIEDPGSSSAECGDEDKVWKAEGGKYYECIDGEWVEGSSSSVESSSSGTSSSSVEKPAWQYLNPAIDYGTMTDSRDGQVYKTVTIGTQTWMAENLNYDPGDVSSMGSYAWSGCYDYESANCSKYGRLYTWEVAMNDANCAYGNSCNPSGIVRGVCPAGWHLPTKEEWQQLVKPMAYSVDDYTTYWYYNGAGVELKTVDGWSYYSSFTAGTNASGFSALPAGNRLDDGDFYGAGSYAIFWSASERSDFGAYRLYLYYGSGFAGLSSYSKNYAFSVRCVQNSN